METGDFMSPEDTAQLIMTRSFLKGRGITKINP